MEGRWADFDCLMTPGLSKDIRVMYDHTVLNGMVQRGREGAERQRGRWMDLGCLMTPGLSKNIRCHV